MATIYDVGKLASVSVATVSAVINNSSYVSPDLRKRVEDAIRELHYSPNLLARGLARQKTQTIGVLVPDIANFFFPELVRGVEDKAKEAGYTILLGSSDNQNEREKLYLDLFLSKRVDGVVLVKAPGGLDSHLHQLFSQHDPPVVLLDREYPDLKADSIVVDDVGGGVMATQRLLALGHTRIGIMCGIQGLSTTEGRLKGYKKALEQANIAFDPKLVVYGGYNTESGYASGLALIEQNPTAVFITNYMMTMGFLQALSQRNLSTPKNISIVGYDDFAWNDIFKPHLTCVVQPKRILGYKAAELLFSRIQKKHKRLRHEVLENSLCVRETSIAR